MIRVPYAFNFKTAEYKVFFSISFKGMHDLIFEGFFKKEEYQYAFFPIDFTEIFRLDADCVGAALFTEPEPVYDYHLLVCFKKPMCVESVKETIIAAFKNQKVVNQNETIFKPSNMDIHVVETSQDLKSICYDFFQVDQSPVFWRSFRTYIENPYGSLKKMNAQKSLSYT